MYDEYYEDNLNNYYNESNQRDLKDFLTLELNNKEFILNKEDILSFDKRAVSKGKTTSFKLTNDFLYQRFTGWNTNEFKILLALFELFHKASRKKQNEIEFSNIEVNRTKDPRNPGYIKIYFKDLRDLSNCYKNKNGYIKELIKSLKAIKRLEVTFTINNEKVHTNFIHKIRELDYSNPNCSNKQVLIQFDTELFDLFDDSNGNFTQIDPNINYLKSKYAIRLYKIVKEHSQKNHGWIDLSLEELNNIFDTNYNYTSKFKKHLDNALNQMDKTQLLRYNTKGQILPKRLISINYEKEKIRVNIQYGKISSHIQQLHYKIRESILNGENL